MKRKSESIHPGFWNDSPTQTTTFVEPAKTYKSPGAIAEDAYLLNGGSGSIALDLAPPNLDIVEFGDEQSPAEYFESYKNAIDVMFAQIPSLSDEEAYYVLHRYINFRTKDYYSAVSFDYDANKLAKLSFTALKKAYDTTEKVYLKRLLEWGLLKETQCISENMFIGFDYDESLSDPIAWADPDKYYFPTAGIHRTVTESSAQQLPSDIVEFINQNISRYPNLTDPDYYPPSPFKKILGSNYNELRNRFNAAEVELAIEVSALFGLDASKLSNEVVSRLFKFGTGLNEDTYNRINNLVTKLSPESRVSFASAFLALEFGDDFGVPLLAIAEKMDESRHLYIDGLLVGVAESLGNIAKLKDGFLKEIDPEWADEIYRGVCTRISEVLVEFDDRLKSDNPKAWQVAQEAMGSVQEWSEGARLMLVESVPKQVAHAGDTTLFHFDHPVHGMLPGAVEVTKHGKRYEDMSAEERRLREGRGARVSITYDTQNRNAALSLIGSERRMALSGRFDKSAYVDPNAEHAPVSFDLFSHHAPKNTRQFKSAKIMSEGRRKRTGEKGAYTYGFMSIKRGNKNEFATLMTKIQNALLERANQARWVEKYQSVGSEALRQAA